jgi:TRAP-type C4-dicarboxylate transport system permease small subunit
MLLGLLPGAVVRALGIFNQLLVLIFALALLGYGWPFFVGATQAMMISSTLQVSRQWVAAAVPLAGLILVVHGSAGLAAALERGRRP